MRKIVLSILIALVAADSETKPESKATDDVIQSIPTSYQFAYSTGNEGPAQLFREEKRNHDGSVTGKYGYVDPNGKLRIVQYSAGVNGYTASGDIGPDEEARRQAQQFQQGDPSVKVQEETWNKMRASNWGNWGPSNWGSAPATWNSGDPNWNSGTELPPPAPQPQPQPPSPSAPTPELERQWDERAQNQWENTRSNNWNKNQNTVDWNTWNSEQQSWNKPGNTWKSEVQHQWQKAQTSGQYRPPQPNNPPSSPQGQSEGQWSQGPKQDSQSGQWTQLPPYPTGGGWSQPPQNNPPAPGWAQPPSAGQWSQDPKSNPPADQWSPPPPPNPQSGQWSQPPQSNPPQWTPPAVKSNSANAQWPSPPGPNSDPLSGGAYTYFSIDHSGGQNSAPQRFQYSY